MYMSEAQYKFLHRMDSPEPDGLTEAKAELTKALGPEGYYEWACSLPVAVVMNDTEYKKAITEKLEDLDYSERMQFTEELRHG